MSQRINELSLKELEMQINRFNFFCIFRTRFACAYKATGRSARFGASLSEKPAVRDTKADRGRVLERGPMSLTFRPTVPSNLSQRSRKALMYTV